MNRNHREKEVEIREGGNKSVCIKVCFSVSRSKHCHVGTNQNLHVYCPVCYNKMNFHLSGVHWEKTAANSRTH